jgi:leucyl aminopeptidase
MNHISKINLSNEGWDATTENLIVSGVYEEKTMSSQAQLINISSENLFTKAIDSGDVNGKVGTSHTFYFDKKILVLIGLGKEKNYDGNIARVVAGNASRIAIKKRQNSFAMECNSGINGEYSQPISEGLVLGSYEFLGYKTKNQKTSKLESVTILGGQSDKIKKGFEIGKSVCLARDLGNHPGNVSTPSKLAEVAKDIANEGGMKLTVFNRKEFTKMGMGGLAGVSQGTDEPPKFIVMEYMGGGEEKPKVLVGKGLTFDAGGISIKSAGKMDEMKYDMCGSTVVLGVFKAIAALKPEMNVVGIIPSTENLLGAKAYKPGDILKAYNGKTIEILNTDAEGRVILSDALSYASKHYKPEYILDFATLTGAVLAALGHIATGIMGTNNELINEVKKSSKSTGEKVWELPLWPEFCKQVESNIADVKNTGAPGQAGTIAGAAFLKEFVSEEIPWVHFDIAGTAWGVKPDSINPRNSATGWGVRLVLDMLKV